MERDRILAGLEAFIEQEWEEKRDSSEDLDAGGVRARWTRLSSRLRAEENGAGEAAEIPAPVRRIRRPSLWYKVAAAAAVLILVTVLYQRHQRPVKAGDVAARGATIYVPNGQQKQLALSDGTRVWLNGGSTLSYGSGFGTDDRRVELQGEGFFEVASDAGVPFTVETDKITIRVLGTSFNVKDYGNEDNVQTTLISGSIQVSVNGDADKKILLSPREKLTVMKGEIRAQPGRAVTGVNPLKYKVQGLVPLSPTDSNAIPETAWMGDKIAFVDEPFGEVAKKMEHRYNVHIFFKDKDLSRVVMRGVFEKESVQQALKILQMITPFRYEQKGDSIYLYP
jgi:ferric-dicitrate binding protein FerR (iron transport regulator)